MNINIIRIRSDLHEKNKEMLKENDAFIDELNTELMNDDLLLVENDESSPMSVVFVESGGSEVKFIPLLDKLKDPIILLSNGKNNSLPASLEIKTYIRQKGRDCFLLTGDEENIALGIRRSYSAFNASKVIDNSNLGVIGTPSDWLIASKVDYKLVKDKFNINLIDIPMLELEIELKNGIDKDIPHKEQFEKKFKNKEVLNGALTLYSALKRIVKRYNLKGFTLRCFDLLTSYKNTSCLAFSILNEEGITAACEGDVPSLLTMFFIKALTDLPSFQTNPSYVDLKNNTILFAHCTLPLNMAQKYTLTTHFESGIGIGVKAEMPLGKVSVIKLAPSLKIEDSVAFSGNIKRNLSLPNYCRTQIEIEPEEDNIITLFRDDFGNHMIITYADCVGGFYNLLNLYETRYKANMKKEEKEK
ncbi:MAG: hypothetical protein IJK27_02130 [Bacilli bacterium]|nr:hypothetical protein [Bacilli bacterium]